MKMLRLAVAALLALSGHAAQAACDLLPGLTKVTGQNVTLVFKTQPQPIKVGELFKVDITLCPKVGPLKSIGVDATMPEHKHGMNYKPTIRKNSSDSFSAEGLMFHMPGRWQFAFDVETGAGRERVLYNVDVR